MRNWLIILGLTVSLGLNAQGDVKVRLVNAPMSGNFETYSKVELGIELPQSIQLKMANFFLKTRVSNYDKVNPFLDWDLNVVAVFRQEESNKTIRVPAFYFRDFKRDTIQNKYVPIDVPDNMRVRFAPPVAGKWTVKLEWSVKSKPQPATGTVLEFDVVNSNNPGYVTLHPNRRNFQLGDSIFYPVGVNFPSPMKDVINYHTIPDANGKTPYGPDETHLVVKPKAYLRYMRDIQDYVNSGGKYIRILQSAWGSLLEFEEKGNYYNRMHYAWEQDQLIEFCEANDVFVQFNLLQQEPFMKYGNYDMFDWDWSHYDRDGNYHSDDPYPAYCYAQDNKKAPHEMFMNEIDLNYHEQRLRYYLARYGYATHIYLFELLSEPWHLDQLMSHEPFFENTPEGAVVRKAVVNYQARMATYMRKNVTHAPQLIGVDMSIAHVFDGPWGIDSSIYIPEVDVVGINPYSPVPEKLVIKPSEENNVIDPAENTMRRVVQLLSENSGKAVIISEGGAGDGVDEKSDYAQQKLDMASFGFSGFAGFNSWIGWFQGHEVNWPYMFVVQSFLNNAAFKQVLQQGNGKWVHGVQAEKLTKKDKKRSKEMQYYVAENGGGAVGYIKNRSYNFWTKATKVNELPYDFLKTDPQLGTLTDISWEDGKPLYVSGLKKGKKVRVTWYNGLTGAAIATEEFKWKRKFVMRHPLLRVETEANELPICWFSITVE
jgi:hypothetical protein